MPSLTFRHTWLREQTMQTKRNRQNLELETDIKIFSYNTRKGNTDYSYNKKAGVPWESASRTNFPDSFQ